MKKNKPTETYSPLPSATLHILVSLLAGEKHGYAIMGDVETLSDGLVKMGPGTLYGSIKRMLADGLIEEIDERPDPELDDQRRRYYRLTGLGERICTAEVGVPRGTGTPSRLTRVGSSSCPPSGRSMTVMSTRAPTRHEALYRHLLVLYPRSFRDDYGQPMVQLFGDRLRDVGARAWLRTISDLASTAPTERIEAVMSNLSPGVRVGLIGVTVIAGGVAAMALGAGMVPFVAAAAIALIATQRKRLVTTGQSAPLHRALIQAWWAPVAGLVGALLVLAGFGTILEAHNLGGRVFGSSILFAFGFGMIWGLVRRPFDRQGGNTMILVSTIPLFPFFWLLVPPVLGIVIWIGVLTSGFADEPVASTTH